MSTSSPLPASSSAFQYVPVPNEHVAAVMTFLADLLAGSPVVPPSPSSTSGVDATEGWTDEELYRFSTMGTKTSENVSHILDLLCETPGVGGALSTRELADSLKLDYKVIKAVPTQVTRVLSRHFPDLGTPYLGLWGTTDFAPARTDEMYYAVTSERAEQWKRVRKMASGQGA